MFSVEMALPQSSICVYLTPFSIELMVVALPPGQLNSGIMTVLGARASKEVVWIVVELVPGVISVVEFELLLTTVEPSAEDMLVELEEDEPTKVA